MRLFKIDNLILFRDSPDARSGSRLLSSSTVDLKSRTKHHLGGHIPSTKRFGKIKLVFSQEYRTLKEARIIEKKLKKLKRKDYLQKIIQDGFIKIKP